jgi:hypothetical protein
MRYPYYGWLKKLGPHNQDPLICSDDRNMLFRPLLEKLQKSRDRKLLQSEIAKMIMSDIKAAKVERSVSRISVFGGKYLSASKVSR